MVGAGPSHLGCGPIGGDAGAVGTIGFEPAGRDGGSRLERGVNAVEVGVRRYAVGVRKG